MSDTKQTYREEGDKILLNTYQDVEPHLEYAAKCRRLDREERGRFGKRPEMHRVMSVPFNVIMAVAQRLDIPAGRIFETDCMKRIVSALKSPEFAYFRTVDGKL